MKIESEMALLAAGSYWDIRDANPSDPRKSNRGPLPEGWTIIPQYDISRSGANSGLLGDGFSARVYQGPGGQIVISYAGTEFGDTVAGVVADFLSGNVPLAVGRYAEQAYQAALLYQRVLANATLSDNITFTGHSLGGGLASLMAVWFDRPAYVFAPAPFQLSADGFQSTVVPDAISALVLPRVRYKLGTDTDPKLRDYNPTTDFAARERNVQAWTVTGEVLGANLGMFNWIEGSSNLLYNDPANSLASLDKHSIDLHVAALITPNFETQANKLPTALERIFDSSLYGYAVTGNQQDFLVALVRNEVGVRDDQGTLLLAPNGMLTHFAADLRKLGTNIAGLNQAAQNALIAQSIEWYYWQGNDYTGQDLFTGNGSLLQYTTAQGAGLAGAQNKAAQYVRVWLDGYVGSIQGNTLLPRTPNYAAFEQWNVVASTAGVTAAALDAGKLQVFIGNSGADAFTGSAKDDLLYGGGGDDVLDGGAGADRLVGGAGKDTYTFAGAFGKDLLVDSDGQGLIKIDDQTLSQAKGTGKRDAWTAKLDNGEFVGLAVYANASSSTGKNLVITRAGSTDNTITINNFDLTAAEGSNGYLGIKLDPTQHVALVQGGGLNFWNNADADISSLDGRQSDVGEGGGAGFSISLAVAAKAGDTLTLNLGGQGSTCKAILGNATVDANGAIITLAEGQTQVSFALVQDGALDADQLASLSVSYSGDGQTAASNTWNLTLQDSGDPTTTLNGDIIARSQANNSSPITRVGVEGNTVTVVDPGAPYFIQDDNGNLVDGGSDFSVTSNAIFGTTDADAIDGKTGNDLLDGWGGNDRIDGGSGDDLIAGGEGNDTLLGGEGDDYILSAGTAGIGQQQRGPLDQWSQWGKPAGVTVLASGDTWGVYTPAGQPGHLVFSGIDTVLTNSQRDVVDAGVGNDYVIASWGGDRIQGREGNDTVVGLAGDDIIEGDEGDDKLMGDGSLQATSLDFAPEDSHGSDFIDGGDGNDEIDGGGNGDQLFGGEGNDRIFGETGASSDGADFIPLQYQGADYIDGEGGDDYIEGGGNDDALYGGDGADMLWGDSSVDKLKGATASDATAWGNDYLDGEAGDDSLVGGGKDDTLYGGDGADVLYGDESNAALPGDANGNDYLDGEGGNDILIGGGKDDTLFGGEGDDFVSGDDDQDKVAGAFQGNDYLDGEAGNDTVVGGGKDDNLFGGAGDDLIFGDATQANVAGELHGNDYLDGEDGNDRLIGGGKDDTLSGGAGNDYMSGDDTQDNVAGEFHGNDYLDGGDGNDTLFGGGKDDTLFGGADNDILLGDQGQLDGQFHGNDYLDGGDGNDQLAGWGKDDTLFGGAGDDILMGDSTADALDGSFHGADSLDGGDGNDQLEGSGGADTLIGGAGDDLLIGDAPLAELAALWHGDDLLDGGDGNDTLFGNDGNDTLLGGGGNDVLVSGNGDDSLDGGTGDDRYVILGTDGNKTISDQSGSNTLALGWYLGDILITPGSLIFTNVSTGQRVHLLDRDDPGAGPTIDYVEIENGAGIETWSLEDVLSTLRVQVTGTDGADYLQGTPYADSLDGGAGADTLVGLGGDDIYVLGDNTADTIVEELDGGWDGISANFSYSLEGTELEAIYLGGSDNVDATGNALDNVLSGNDSANVLDGREGADYMWGGAGNDVFFVDNPDDHVYEGPDEGMDTIHSNIDISLSPGVENLVLHGDAIYGAGNDEDNVIEGTDGSNTLAGGAGADTLVGGAGDDLYLANAAEDVIVEEPDQGVDELLSNVNIDLSQPGLENIENARLAELSDAGDWFRAEDWDAFNATGNALDNVIAGNSEGNVLEGLGGSDVLKGMAGNDDLDGGEGADTLIGGQGDDIYHLDNPGDVATEVVRNAAGDVVDEGGGHDLAYGSVSVTLGEDIDDATLVGSDDIDATGNELDNILTGNDGSNRLTGGTGVDVLVGGAGNDSYWMDPDDQAIEEAGGGTDTVYVASDWTLGSNLENLVLLREAGGVQVGAGNELDNVITGNDLGDTLRGFAGCDTLTGGMQADLLDGGQGADVMAGGFGDDAYLVDDAGDQVIEWSDEGADLVSSSVDYTLAANVENMVLTDSAALGVGNELDNVLEGNAADNTLSGLDGADVLNGQGGRDLLLGGEGDDSLDGGAGADTMRGDAGNDVYQVDNAGDVVQDDGGEADLVNASVSHTLAAGIEYLVLQDTAVEGIGNSQDNEVIGNGFDNVLEGGAGNDSIVGGDGSDQLLGDDGNDWLAGETGWDTLTGGAGDDTYELTTERRNDVVVEDANGGRDQVWLRGFTSFFEDPYALAANVEDLVLGEQDAYYDPFENSLSAIGNELDNDMRGSRNPNYIDGSDGNDTVDGWSGNDTIEGGAGNDSLYGGDDASALVRPAYGFGDTSELALHARAGGLEPQFWDGDEVPAFLDEAHQDSWLLQTDTNSDYIDGGDGDDLIDGGSGDDQLYGGDGADQLYGGSAQSSPGGDDFLDGGAGIDVLMGGDGDDTYIVDGVATPNPDGGVPQLELCDGKHRFGMDRAPGYAWIADTVIETAADDGYDVVWAYASVDLSDAVVEDVYLQQAVIEDIDAKTGAGRQVLYGNLGNNRLDGGAGADYMGGWLGDDTYIVDDAGDVVDEYADQGFDTVRTALDGYVLGDSVEGLVLEGAQDISGQGNAADNLLVGNTGNNELQGADGNDTLAGWRGDDRLQGGAGEDTYAVARGDGSDLIDDLQGNGTLHFSGDIRPEEISIRADGNDLVIVVAGGASSSDGAEVRLRDWIGAAERVTQLTFCQDPPMALEQPSVNAPPVALADEASVVEDGPAATGNVLGNDSDPDPGDTLAVIDAGTRSGRYGTLSLQADGSYSYALDSTRADIQSLAQGQQNRESFQYTAADQAGASATALLTVLITGANDAPAAATDSAVVGEDAVVEVRGSVLANDSDPDTGDTLTVTTTGSETGAYGTLQLAADGSYSYTLDNASASVQSLAAGQIVSESFAYTASDNYGATATSTLTVTISGANDGPVAVADSAGVAEDAVLSVTGNVLANDSDVDANDLLRVANAGTYAGQYGTLTLGADGTFGYALNNSIAAVQSLAAGQSVNESFSYTVTDNAATGSLNAQGTITVRLDGNNDAPVLVTPAADVTAREGEGLSLDLPDTMFQDIDQGDLLGYSVRLAEGAPLPGWLNFDPNGLRFTGTPPRGAAGQFFDIELTAMDRSGATASDLFRITVSGAPALTLIGGPGNDTLVGGDGNDTLDGKAGADEMRGGLGDDTYYVDAYCNTGTGKGNEGLGNGQDPPPPGHDFNWNDGPGTSPGNPGRGKGNGCSPRPSTPPPAPGDTVLELAGQGWDTVLASVSYVLPDQVEALRLQGTSNLDGLGNAGSNWLVGNEGSNTLSGNEGNDLLSGGGGNDYLYGGVGSDVLEGQDGDDALYGGDGADALLGGAGADVLNSGGGRAFIAGGKQNDSIVTGQGATVVAFNRGDGADSITTQRNALLVLSLGGGIRLEDVSLRRDGNDLFLDTGDSESIRLVKWYAGNSSQPQLKLQFVTEAANNYAPGGDELHDNKVAWFNGQGLVSAFDRARQKNSSLTHWDIMNAALANHLGGSDTAALGGDLSYQYGLTGTPAGMGLDAATGVLANSGFVTQAQALQTAQQLEIGMARLSG
jgi:VCBS repeat-containing protein